MLYEEIQLGCKLYHEDKRGPGYDRAYNSCFSNPNPNINDLISFLSSWGCRKATLMSHRELELVLQEVEVLLEPLKEKELTILTIQCDEDFSIVEKAFRKLLGVKNASSTSASKILHVVNPSLLLPWDWDISREYAYSDDSKQYAYQFLPIVQREAKCVINQVKEESRGILSSADALGELKSCYHDKRLPSTIGTFQLVKLLDEYNFMKYTRKHPKLAD